MGIISFKNKGTEAINCGRSSKEALRILPQNLHKKAQVKLARLGAANSIQDLREIRGNRFEVLKGNRGVEQLFNAIIRAYGAVLY